MWINLLLKTVANKRTISSFLKMKLCICEPFSTIYVFSRKLVVKMVWRSKLSNSDWEGISFFLGQKKKKTNHNPSKKPHRVQQLHTQHPRVISWLQFIIYCSYTLNILHYCTADPAVDPHCVLSDPWSTCTHNWIMWILSWRQYFEQSIYTLCSQWSDFHISHSLTRVASVCQVCRIPLHDDLTPDELIKINLRFLSYNFSKIKCHRVL